MDIVIVGAGVSGLTTGVCLAEAGHRVIIRTAAPPERTTSVAAGALWGPVHAGPPDRVSAWARHSLEIFTGLAAEPGTGVRLVTGKEITRGAPRLPHWSGLLPSLRMCEPSELPPGFCGGWHYTAPLATMPVYLGYLRARFERAGGTVELSKVSTLEIAPVVINCAGVAARDLVPDPSVYPVRGQVVIAENPGVEEFLICRDGPAPYTAYMFPHGDKILIGGTMQENDWNLTPYPLISERLMVHAAGFEPRLHGARVVGHRVGLRPMRPQVRVAARRPRSGNRRGTLVWHNYGHGGAGVSLSWGCAAEIAAALS